MLTLLRDVLNRLPEAEPGTKVTNAVFETEYSRSIARRLDRLQLFGVTASS